MNDKKKFGEYVQMKRKSMNMTQGEFAEKLFVNPTTVSKWERGVSFPDIMMIPAMCRELNITEHEFFTACDDHEAAVKNLQAKRYQYGIKGLKLSLLAGYVLAILICLICNLWVEHSVSWFYIVLVSIMLSFSMTHLYGILKKKGIRHKEAIVLAVISGCVMLLLWVCEWYGRGDWLLSIGLPITVFELLLVWLGLGLIRYTNWNVYFKSAGCLALTGICVIATNPLCAMLLKEPLSDGNLFTALCGALLMAMAIVFFVYGCIKKTQIS